MALTKCTECSGEMSTLAQKCPHCGAPVANVPVKAIPIQRKPKQSIKIPSFERDASPASTKSRLRGAWFVAFFAVAIMLFAIGYYQLNTAAKEMEKAKVIAAAEAKAREIRETEERLIMKGQEAVRDHLKDPESARFKNVYVSIKKNNFSMHFVQKPGDRDSFAICGLVNAKNGMGGYVGFRRFFSNGKDGGLIESENDDDFQGYWDELCAK